MKRQAVADTAMTVAVLFLGASLVFAGSVLLRHRTGGPHGAAPLELAEMVGAAAAGIGLAVTLWWLAALACALISALACHCGRPRLASRAGACSPAFMRRLAAVVLGLNLVAAPMATAASAAGAPIDPQWHPVPVAEAPLHVPPTAAGAAGPAQAAGRAAALVSATPPVNPAWTPQAPAADPGPLARPQTRTPVQQGAPASLDADAGAVVVRGGDSLWGIVASALGPYATDVEVAQAWPEWYRANRSVIGGDPNVILPGQVLHAPAA